MIARLRSLPFRARAGILAGAAVAGSAALLIAGPIPQDPAYHAFADGRTLLGIPNFWDVATNAPFVVVGLLGMALARRAAAGDPAEKWIIAAVFGSLALTGAGSAYYHWAPDNARIVWDRLPLALMFTAILAAVLADRIGPRAGARLAVPLMAFGAASVLYWGWTESRGAGDLRLYVLAQFLTIALILLAVTLFPPRTTRSADLLWAAAAYGLAKACEVLDRPIFEAGNLWSGHTLKHLFAALAAAILLAMFVRRRPTGSPPPCSPAPPGGPSAPSAPSGSRPA